LILVFVFECFAPRFASAVGTVLILNGELGGSLGQFEAI
jgi:hypothetical protein